MDGSGRVTNRNRQYIKRIMPYKSALAKANTRNNSHALVPVKRQIISQTNNAPCAGNVRQTQPAGDKSAPIQLPAPDTWSQEVEMTDQIFDEGLTQAVYNTLNDEITTVQPEAPVKLPTVQPAPNTRTSKRVKFAPNRLIEQ